MRLFAMTLTLGMSAALVCVAADQASLTQKEAEDLTNKIYVQQCDADTVFQQTVKLGAVNKSAYIYGSLKPETVYPVQKTFSGSCVAHPMGRTDWGTVDAKYTTNFYRDSFGDWKHTPVLGVCNYQRTAYQVEGQPKVDKPDAKGSCNFAEKQ